MSASQISAALAAQKFWTASLNAQAGRAVSTYSQRLGKPLAEWAGQDGNHANMLQQIAHTLSKRDGVTQQFSEIPTNMIPFAIPPIKPPKPDDAEEAAIAILTGIAASEYHQSKIFRDTAGMHEARDIFQILDLEAVAEVSATREQTALEMINQIKTGRLWQADVPVFWRCLQCGSRHHSKTAFDACSCCKAGRQFATAGGW